jgi:hypothetical protein
LGSSSFIVAVEAVGPVGVHVWTKNVNDVCNTFFLPQWRSHRKFHWICFACDCFGIQFLRGIEERSTCGFVDCLIDSTSLGKKRLIRGVAHKAGRKERISEEDNKKKK